MRVRYCAQARAVENQCFVVMSGNVGNLPGVENMDVQYAQSCILTPCDFPFARDGIAAERSDAHTSELQSLMRISYAVFCLKKTKELTDSQAAQPPYQAENNTQQ